MKDYLRWSLQQFYLLYFWPTRFRREVEGEGREEPRLRLKGRVVYLLKLLPYILLINVFTNIVIGFICEGLGIPFRWGESWSRTAFLIGLGLALSTIFGAAGGVVVATMGAVSGSLMGGAVVDKAEDDLAGGLIAGMIDGGTIGVMSSVAVGAEFGIIGSIAGSLTRSTAGDPRRTRNLGVAGGIALCVVGIILNGVTIGLISSIAFWLTYFRLFSYPLNAALSLVAYLRAKQHPDSIKRAWRICPVAWNEVIWLPLPYAASLLTMLTMQDREEGFRQIAFVAAERRLQRRVALRASEEIVFNDLRAASINRLANVADNLSWTTDAPAELPGVLASAFPRFERTARHAGQYLILHSDHRKEEALKQALAELAGLQKSLIAASGRLGPRLLQTANEWRALLEAEQKTLRTKLTETRETPNPFAFGNALGEIKNNPFVGRQDLVRKIEDSILGTNQMPTLLLHGARRMGKTSILYQLPHMLGPDIAPVLIDCQEAAFTESRATTLRYLSLAICKGLQRRRVKVNPLTRPELAHEPFSVFKDWLEDVERVWPQGLRVLLCFDEYERLQETLDAGWGHGFLDTLRNWIQHHPHLVLMFTGAHAFEELGPEWTDRFISARRMRISFLAREDLELLLTKPIPEFDLTYRDGVLDAIIHTTNGQPFLTQAVAFELVQHLNEQHRKEATPEDVEAAIAQALVSGSAYFHNVWTDAREQGQAILSAIARNETPPDYPAARVWLNENDVLNEFGDFAVPMVRRWVSETRLHQNPMLLKSDS